MKNVLLAIGLALAPWFACCVRAEAPRQTLNILYFVPSDMEPLPGHARRLGRILREVRDFYNRELERNGSEARLRMPLDPETGLVALEIVRAKRPLAEYPYATGGGVALPEINAYLAAHPRDDRSDRTLVIMPTRGEPTVPFYGFGAYCFALDYEGFDFQDCGRRTPAGEKFSKWYGGLAHELGHGLGLPHTHATVSQERAGLGTALMGAGNTTLGLSPTFLTPPDCAFLESSSPCRVFQPRPLARLNGLAKLDVERTGGAVRVSGTLLPAPHSVRRLVAAYDKDAVGGVNDNYDAESFLVPLEGETFDFAFPMEEIHPGKTAKAQVQLRFIHDDGTVELILKDL